MYLMKKTPRPHGKNEPFRHENHPRPVTRRQLLGAGFLSGPAFVLAPAWLGALLKPQSAAALDGTINAFENECQIKDSGAGGAAAGPLPFIVIDLAGGANLIGSEALVGVGAVPAAGQPAVGAQTNFLSAAGYSKLGLPGSMIPTSSTFIDNSLGLLFHSDSAIARGIKTKASAATLAGVSGVVIPAMSQNDTGNNPLNPMYGIAKAARAILTPTTTPTQYGSLLTLCGTQSSVSGGNSASPAIYVDATLQPTKIAAPADDTGLVSTSGSAPNQDTVAALGAQLRISTGGGPQGNITTPAVAAFDNPAPAILATTTSTAVPAVPPGALSSASLNSALVPGNATADAALREQVRCAYAKTGFTADRFGSPAALDPTADANLIAASGAVFTPAEIAADADLKKTASVAKLVLNGFAGAGTITLGGFDYHSGNRVDGETKNAHAGVVIGAILDYARRVGRPVMIQVISDGSLTSTGNVDTATAARGKLGWQGDNQQVAASFILAYSPKGRPVMNTQQIGYMNADGTVNAMSSPAANANNLLVQTVILNWMAANGTVANFKTLFPAQGLGANIAPYTAFNQIT
jgi:hypothetical protein